MKLKIFLIISFVFSLIPFQKATACVAPPSVMAGPMCNLAFDPATFTNKTTVEKILKDNKENCELTPEDVTLLISYITNGYSAIRQSQPGFETFLKEAKAKNAERPKQCPAYIAVTHKDDWTALIFSDTAHSKQTGCAEEKCQPLSVHVIENAL